MRCFKNETTGNNGKVLQTSSNETWWLACVCVSQKTYLLVRYEIFPLMYGETAVIPWALAFEEGKPLCLIRYWSS